jgi:hypothetical protein
LLLTRSSAGMASAISNAMPVGNSGTPCVTTVLKWSVAVQEAELSWLFFAVSVMVVVLPMVLGAVTFTDIVWLIESDVPLLGTGLGRTLTTVQAPFELAADIVNEDAYVWLVVTSL